MRINRTDWNKLITDPDHPLMNRAIQAQLAPGSTFKILMSVAGLQEGVAQKMHVFCAGGATFYGQFHACDRHHGMVDIEHAIPWSCDTFYYTLADKLGIDTIARYAQEVGLGQRPASICPTRHPGIVPSSEWKLKNYHEKWYVGETVSVGIGQGPVTVTPIQLARMISGIASDGHFVRPHVVDPAPAPRRVPPGAGGQLSRLRRSHHSPRSGELDDHHRRHGRSHRSGDGRHGRGLSPGGSRFCRQDRHCPGGQPRGAIKDEQGKEFLPNGWFVGVIPRRNPEFVVAVLWEHGDWGSNAASSPPRWPPSYVNKQRARTQNLARGERPSRSRWARSGLTPARRAQAGSQPAARRDLLP